MSWPGSVVAPVPMSEIPKLQEATPVVGIIDPDPVARDGLRTLLHGVGVDVSTFDSAEGYLLAATGRQLSCLIVDLLLPGMSGLEFLRRLRSAGNDTPIVLLADESDVPTAVAAMREGATDFIEKPYVNVAVLRQVQKLLRKGKDDDARVILWPSGHEQRRKLVRRTTVLVAVSRTRRVRARPESRRAVHRTRERSGSQAEKWRASPATRAAAFHAFSCARASRCFSRSASARGASSQCSRR